MGFRIGVITVLLLLIVAGGAASATTQAGTIRVATFNVENYNLSNRMVDGVYRFNYPKPEVEKSALREIIREVRPDVLALQEMGPMPFLLELQRDLRREGMDYPHLALMTGPDTVRMVAVLSRLPFAGVTLHDDLDFPYFGGRENVKRGLLEVRFENAGIEWALFTLHLKSKFTEREDDPQGTRRRVGEAHAARERIRSIFPEGSTGKFLIAGDFNDTRATPTLSRFLGVGDRTISVIVEAADSRGETWTHFFGRHEIYSRIDFILASPPMQCHIVPGSPRVVDVPQWRTASDHRMVVVDLVFEGR